MIKSLSLWIACAIAALIVLPGCGSGSSDTPPPAPPPAPATFSIGGTVFSSGGTIVLQDNGGDDLSLGNVGTFTFATQLVSGAPYAVTVKSSPGMPLQTCVTGSNTGGPATGTVAGADVNNLFVFCSPVALMLGGNVTGLVGSGLVLASNLQALPVAANGNFQFTAPILSTASYAVTVQTQPSSPAQTCIVANGSGNQPIADVTGVQVTCSAPGFACGTENGTVVTHSTNIAASETWAGDGTVHLIPNSIAIAAPATVTIQKCAIVKLADNAGIDVRGASTGTAAATLLAAGDDPVNGRVYFRSTAATPSPAHRWRGLTGLNPNSLVELHNATLSDVAPSTTAAAIVMSGGATGTLPAPVLKVENVVLQNLGGPGVHLGIAAFTTDSTNLQIHGAAGYPIELSAMALGSIPSGDYTGNMHDEALVVDNANVFDNLDIRTTLPIRFNTSGVHVGGLAPNFVPNLTLTLEAGVILRFAKWPTGPTMVTFGDVGQTTDKNAALVVRGTAASPVALTSGEAVPLPGDWAGLWLVTSNGSQIDHLVIEYAGGDAAVGPLNCGPIDPSIHQQARHTAPLLVGDGTDRQYVPPPGLITNSIFRNNAGNFAIDSVWQSTAFGPSLNATNSFGGGARFCTQSKNLIVGGCVVAGVDQSGCLVP